MTVRKSTKYLVVHVTATPPSSDIGVKEVRAMHRARGWSDIGYHWVIRRDGTVEKGRPEKNIGAHVEGFNSVSLGVSLVGGVNAAGKPENNATPAQMEALNTLLIGLLDRYPAAVICGHRDLSPDKDGDGMIEPHEHTKSCPCFDAIPWAARRGLPAANIRGSWDVERRVRLDPRPTGPDARAVYLQRLLARAGFAFGPIDGLIGSRTNAAIRAYQMSVGLPKTGRFDEATVSRLRATFEAKAA